MKKLTLTEIKKWRKHWEDRGYKLVKVILADDAKFKRSFHKKRSL